MKTQNTNKLRDLLYTVLCVVRLFVLLPLIVLCLFYVPVMYLLGVSKPVDKWIKLNEWLVFDVKD